MSRKPKRKPRRAEIIAFPSTDRPHDAVGLLHEAIDTGKLEGVVLIMSFGADEELDYRVCGSIKRSDVVWVGANLLTDGLGR